MIPYLPAQLDSIFRILVMYSQKRDHTKKRVCLCWRVGGKRIHGSGGTQELCPLTLHSEKSIRNTYN